MKQINYNHLLYFYEVAQAGSIAKAARKLHVTPQTISGQINAMEQYLDIRLFDRVGKRLVLNQAGQTAFGYAHSIFTTGEELLGELANCNNSQPLYFNVGVIDIIPKVLAFDLLKQCFELDDTVKLLVKEGSLNTLLPEMALNRIDLILSDQPAPAGMHTKCYSHILGESSLTLFCASQHLDRYCSNFPDSLNEAPFLMPGDKSAQKSRLLAWFDRHKLQPQVSGEFDDTALMKMFGQQGYGVFSAPTATEAFVLEQFDVGVIARLDEVKEQFYAITPKRNMHHPAIDLLISEASKILDHSSAA